MRLLLVLASTLLATLGVTPASAAPTYSVGLSATDGVPARGSVTVTWTAQSADPEGACQLPGDPAFGRCAGSMSIVVVAATVACTDALYGAHAWQLGQSSGTVQLRTAATGANRVCATMTAGALSPVVVARAETTFTTEHVYPTVDLDCANFANQAAAQQEFNRWRPADPHRLDGDNDGKVCERSPCPCYFGAEYPNPGRLPQRCLRPRPPRAP